jgi:hypothetical protein
MKKYFFIIIFYISLSAQAQLYVPIDHRVYSFLTYLEIQAKIPLLADVKPYTNKEIKSILINLDFDNLTNEEKKLYNSFKMEFLNIYSERQKEFELTSYSFIKSIFKDFINDTFADSLRPLLMFHDSLNYLRIGLNLENDFYLKNGQNSLVQAYTYNLYGTFDNISFAFTRQDISLNGNNTLAREKSPFLKSKWLNSSLNVINSADYSTSYLAYHLNYFTINLGKYDRSIGAGHSGKLTLDDKSINPFAAFSVDFNWRFLHINSLHGSLLANELQNDKIDSVATIKNDFRQIPDKYFVSHRFEIKIFDNLLVHYNELLIYGNRSIDLNYLNPFAFLRPTEHELHDRDNALITLGFKWQLKALNLLTYTDIILDEWKLKELGTDWFGNKHGILNGLSWSSNKFTLNFEHTSIAPWVYTHRYDVNKYTHDSRLIGYNLGPNSQSFYLSLGYFANSTLSFNVNYRQTNKGNNFAVDSNTVWNIGGDIFKGHRNDNKGDISSVKETRSFLEGIFTQNKILQMNLTYQPNYYFISKIKFEYSELEGNYFNFFTGFYF